jgi:hypothetical protein
MGNEGTPGKPTTRVLAGGEGPGCAAGAAAAQGARDHARDGPAGRRSDRLRGGVVADLGQAVRHRRGGRAWCDDGEAQRILELEQENRELRRANDLLKRASAFFAAELCATRRDVDREVVRDHFRRAVAAA